MRQPLHGHAGPLLDVACLLEEETAPGSAAPKFAIILSRSMRWRRLCLVELGQSLLATAARIWNLYGPTETNAFGPRRSCSQRRNKLRISVGHPIRHTQAHVLINSSSLSGRSARRKSPRWRESRHWLSWQAGATRCAFSYPSPSLGGGSLYRREISPVRRVDRQDRLTAAPITK